MQIGVDLVGFRSALAPVHRHARWLNHVNFDALGVEPSGEPEAAIARLIHDDHSLDRAVARRRTPPVVFESASALGSMVCFAFTWPSPGTCAVPSRGWLKLEGGVISSL